MFGMPPGAPLDGAPAEGAVPSVAPTNGAPLVATGAELRLPPPSMAEVGSELADPSTDEPLALPKFLPAKLATKARSAIHATPHGRKAATEVPLGLGRTRGGGPPRPNGVPQRWQKCAFAASGVPQFPQKPATWTGAAAIAGTASSELAGEVMSIARYRFGDSTPNAATVSATLGGMRTRPSGSLLA